MNKDWDEYDHRSSVLLTQPRYRCCCGNMNVKQGTKLIAIVTAAVLVIVGCALAVWLLLDKDADLTVAIPSSAGGLLLGLLVVICLVIGIRREHARWLAPYLILMAIPIIACALAIIAAGILAGITVIQQKTPSIIAITFLGGLSHTAITTYLIIVITCLFVLVFIVHWVWWVVLNCARYFLELGQQRKLSRYYHPASPGDYDLSY